MNARGSIRLALLAGLLTGAIQVAQAQAPEASVTPPPTEVSVDCISSPERVVITNNRGKPIRVKSITSTYQPRAGEPYKLKKAVKPGKSATYTFGTGNGRGKRLSRSFIFDNDDLTEAVVVRTSKGRVRVSCADGTNRPPEPEVAEPEATLQPPVDGEPMEALSVLESLAVRPETDEGYDRALFKHWVDSDGDGCDTREEVLIAESLTPVEFEAGCSIVGGTWLSLFDGDTITNPASIDINHTVPLQEAWKSGAYAWSPGRREAFANDLVDDRSLRAASSGANREQGEDDPAVWLPADQDAACEFVADWVAIKASWGLSVDEMERDALETTLGSCPDRTIATVLR